MILERVVSRFRDLQTRRLETVQWRGFSVNFDAASDIGRSLRVRGQFEEGEIDLSVAFLTAIYPKRSVIDIGANIGLHTLAWSRFAQVIAVEPAPNTFARLSANVSRNGLESQIQLVQAAVNESAGDVEFFVTVDDAYSGMKDTGRKHVVDRLLVPGTTLNDLSELSRTPIGLVKIDVEGFEQSVVAGGTEFIARDRPILFIEIYGGQNSNADPTGTIETIIRLGYEPFVFSPENGLHRYASHSDDEYNYFFLPRL